MNWIEQHRQSLVLGKFDGAHSHSASTKRGSVGQTEEAEQFPKPNEV